MNDDLSNYAGQVAFLSVIGVGLDENRAVTGLPIRGAGHTINSSLQVGTLTAATPGGAVSFNSLEILNSGVEHVIIEKLVLSAKFLGSTVSVKVKETGQSFLCQKSISYAIISCNFYGNVLGIKLQKSASLTFEFEPLPENFLAFLGGDPLVSIVAVGETYGYQLILRLGIAPSTPSITVVSPNGGEKWQIGSMHTITWTPYEPGCAYPNEPYCDPVDAVNPADSVTAMLDQRISNGQFITIGKVYEGGKASLHWDGVSLLDSSDSYLEATPGDYYIRVVNNTTGAWDRSDKPFSLMPQDSVTADLKINGSDRPIIVPEGGKNYTASWTSNADTCLIYNNTLPWPDAFIGNLAPSGKRTIKLMPNTRTYDEQVALSCSSWKNIEGYVWDSVIVLPSGAPKFSAEIVQPNGEELVSYNSSSGIFWNTTGIEKISLALYKDNKFFAWIVKDFPTYKGTSVGNQYGWRPSDLISQDKIGGNIFKIYMIGKKAGVKGTVTDISDKPFTIAN